MSALLLLVLAAGEVVVQVEPGTPCLEVRKVEAQLVAQGLRVQEGAALKVTARGAGSTVVLEGVRGDDRFVRSVPAPVGQCAAVERVVVSIIESWARPLRLAVPGRVAGALIDAGALVGSGDAGGDGPGLRGAAGSQVVDAGVVAPAAPTSRASVGREVADPSAPRAEAGRSRDTDNSTARVRSVDAGSGAQLADGATARTRIVDAGSGSQIADAGADSVTDRERAGTQSSGAAGPRDETGRTTGANADAGADSATNRERAGSPSAGAAGPRDETGRTTVGSQSTDAGDDRATAPARAETSPLTPDASTGGSDAPVTRTWTLDVALLGGATIGPTTDLAPFGTLRAGLSIHRWGVVLDGAFEGERSRRVDPGTAYASRQWLGLSGRVTFAPLDTLNLDLTLGVRGFRVVVGGRGFVDASEDVKLDLGGALTGGARVTLFGPLALEARAHAALRGNANALKLADQTTGEQTTVLTISPWDVGLSLGLCARY